MDRPRRILVLVDDSLAARPVVTAAAAFAPLLDASLDLVQAGEDGVGTAAAVAATLGLELRRLDCDVMDCLGRELGADDLAAVVVGTRDSPADGSSAGHVARAVLERARGLVIVVPPFAESILVDGVRRVLVPLDGSPEADRAVGEIVRLLAGAEIAVVAVHVFEQATVPSFWVRPEHEAVAWRREFLRRADLGTLDRLELRSGRPSHRILELAEAEGVDAIALTTKAVPAAGRAAVLWDVVERSQVPVLVLPCARR